MPKLEKRNLHEEGDKKAVEELKKNKQSNRGTIDFEPEEVQLVHEVKLYSEEEFKNKELPLPPEPHWEEELEDE